MGQSQGDIAICNRAIAKVGGKRITDFGDDLDESRRCADLYDGLRDEVLVQADWSFARTRGALNALADPPAFGYSHQYALKPGWLRALQVYRDPESQYQLTDWDVESQEDGSTVIVANPTGSSEVIYVVATQRISDPERFSPLFATCLAIRLAMELAIPIAQSRSLKRDYEKEYEVKLVSATSSDGQQGRTKRTTAPALLRVRGRGGAGPFVYGPPLPGA